MLSGSKLNLDIFYQFGEININISCITPYVSQF